MTLTRDAEHGWEIVDGNGRLVTKATPLTFERPNHADTRPVLAAADDGEVWEFACDGEAGRPIGRVYVAAGRSGYATLRNAPAPKQSGVDWIVRYAGVNGTVYCYHFSSEKGVQDYVRQYLPLPTSAREIAIKRVTWTEGDTE